MVYNEIFYTVRCCLTAGIHSEKCTHEQFFLCVMTDCLLTQDGVTCNIGRLCGIYSILYAVVRDLFTWHMTPHTLCNYLI